MSLVCKLGTVPSTWEDASDPVALSMWKCVLYKVVLEKILGPRDPQHNNGQPHGPVWLHFSPFIIFL